MSSASAISTLGKLPLKTRGCFWTPSKRACGLMMGTKYKNASSLTMWCVCKLIIVQAIRSFGFGGVARYCVCVLDDGSVQIYDIDIALAEWVRIRWPFHLTTECAVFWVLVSFVRSIQSIQANRNMFSGKNAYICSCFANLLEARRYLNFRSRLQTHEFRQIMQLLYIYYSVGIGLQLNQQHTN